MENLFYRSEISYFISLYGYYRFTNLRMQRLIKADNCDSTNSQKSYRCVDNFVASKLNCTVPLGNTISNGSMYLLKK
jgi:hypothetical protein